MVQSRWLVLELRFSCGKVGPMTDLVALSSRIIDSGHADEPVNRITNELSELADGVSLVESFSHAASVSTAAGLVVFDTSGTRTGGRVVDALRTWSTDPIHSIVYTHGHLDHVGGSGAFIADGAARGHQRPTFLGHEAIKARFARYRQTNGYNQVINARQFGGVPKSVVGEMGLGAERQFLPDDTAELDQSYRDHLSVTVGDTEFQLCHAKGETDDHTWTWIPDHKMIASGDLMIWNFPNCGNPQKVQRFPLEWAEALRAMAGQGAELFVPAHGLPIGGNARIATVLNTIAGSLESLVALVLDAMNTGASLDEVIQGCTVPEATLKLPFMRPFYDEPEFVVHNIWRLYGGWWDGDAASLKPAPNDSVAAEVAALAGGAMQLVERAQQLVDDGDFRLACQLIEWAGRAEPTSVAIHQARAQIYEARRKAETSLMAKGIYASAVAESKLVTDGDGSQSAQSVTW